MPGKASADLLSLPARSLWHFPCPAPQVCSKPNHRSWMTSWALSHWPPWQRADAFWCRTPQNKVMVPGYGLFQTLFWVSCLRVFKIIWKLKFTAWGQDTEYLSYIKYPPVLDDCAHLDHPAWVAAVTVTGCVFTLSHRKIGLHCV